MIASPPIVLALAGLAVSNWLAAIVFFRLSREAPEIRTLRERAISSVLGAIAVTFGSGLWFLLAQDPSPIPLGEILAGGLAAIVIAALPAIYWLALFLRGTFDGDDAVAGRVDPGPEDPPPT